MLDCTIGQRSFGLIVFDIWLQGELNSMYHVYVCDSYDLSVDFDWSLALVRIDPPSKNSSMMSVGLESRCSVGIVSSFLVKPELWVLLCVIRPENGECQHAE